MLIIYTILMYFNNLFSSILNMITSDIFLSFKMVQFKLRHLGSVHVFVSLI